MSLRDRLGRGETPREDKRVRMFEHFGIKRNPYPPAGEPTGHPHMETTAEESIVHAIESFERDRVSQVWLIEGTQGVGKTNLLNYFQKELQDLHSDDEGYYIIRYYPDPESTFDGILRRVFQEFASYGLFSRLAAYLAELPRQERQAALAIVSSHETRFALETMAKAATASPDMLGEATQLALEWFSGLRILKRHRETLGVNFRLDTVESKTQALRDLVFCCSNANLFNGLYLLLDELEKQDYTLSKGIVLRYLSAIRALIDALPKHLFLLVALTTEAQRRYFSMLPAFAGRLQNIIRVEPLKNVDGALQLNRFYLQKAREEARRESGPTTQVAADPVPEQAVRELFASLLKSAAAEKAQEGVTPRDFLNALHQKAEAAIVAV